VVRTPIKTITLDEFLKLPETKPASEYIDGQISQKPMPQGHHSVIQLELGMELNLALRRKGIAIIFPELRCIFGNRAIVPDLAVFESDRVPVDVDGDIENVFIIAPDWTIEILSPSQSAAKVLKNINHCLAHGTQMGWLIDPESKAITISRANQNILILDALTDLLPVPEFAQDVRLTVQDVFGWLKKSNRSAVKS
jgi:Uma2 family endonuclease